MCRAVYHAEFARCPNDGGALEVRDDDPLIGTTVSHYQLDAFIGGGAMGRVYRCHHVHLQHKQFALKVLRGDLAAHTAMRLRFTQEAEAASRLDHPNVVSVIDFGRTDDGLMYLAMDLVEGDTLGTIIERGPLPATRVVQLAKELCAGLAHAHELGLVHRDFKPDNVIVVRDGQREIPRIVDFGLAIHADPDNDVRLTTAGTAVGTPLYAAPEQASEAHVDHRADLFALGVTMFEMLAGVTPFEGNLLELLYANANADRPAIAARAPNVVVPARLEKLVHELMSVQVDARPTSARAVIRDLAIIELEMAHPAVSVIAIPPSPTTEKIARPTAPGSRWPIVAAALAVVAIGGGAAYLATHSDEPAAAIASNEVKPIERAPPPPKPEVKPDPPARALFDPPVADPHPPETHVATVDPRHHDKPHARHVVAANDPKRPSDPTHVTPPPDPTSNVTVHEDPAGSDVAKPPDATPDPDPKLPVKPPDPPKPEPKLVTSARLALGGMSVRGALTTAQVQRAVDRVTPAIRACYGPAVTKAQKSPPVSLRVRFEIDETEHARSIQASKTELPGLDACVMQALGGLAAEAAPDVGTVDVTFVVKFVPEGA